MTKHRKSSLFHSERRLVRVSRLFQCPIVYHNIKEKRKRVFERVFVILRRWKVALARHQF